VAARGSAELAEAKISPLLRAASEAVRVTTARDIMHLGAECIGEHETLAQAARQMRDADVGRCRSWGITAVWPASSPTGTS